MAHVEFPHKGTKRRRAGREIFYLPTPNAKHARLRLNLQGYLSRYTQEYQDRTHACHFSSAAETLLVAVKGQLAQSEYPQMMTSPEAAGIIQKSFWETTVSVEAIKKRCGLRGHGNDYTSVEHQKHAATSRLYS